MYGVEIQRDDATAVLGLALGQIRGRSEGSIFPFFFFSARGIIGLRLVGVLLII